MSSADVLLDNYARGKQTFIIPLTFTDINDAKDIITDISYGGDIWEARIDLLSPDGPNIGAVNLPPLDYVRAQIKALQAMSALPILFTIRTRSQGGKFPDGASKEALALMLLAVECGVHYIDVEVEWPQSLVQKLQAGKGDAQIVASYHSWTGEIRWTSDELLQRQKAAEEFGDIIKLSILSTSLEDCYELGLFVQEYRKTRTRPLLAVGMGAPGQLSRVTSPISLVTHPKIPFPSAPGQLSLADVHRVQHLIGCLPRRNFLIAANVSGASAIVRAFQAAFEELGYPYSCMIAQGIEEDEETIFSTQGEVTIDGLVEAMEAQFTSWTGRRAPSSVFRTVLRG